MVIASGERNGVKINTMNYNPTVNGADARKLRLLYATFFATGFSALLYQVIWQRLLALFAGSDTISVSIVVGAFLGGLGIGSLLGSFIADRLSSRHALMAFSLFNVGIAVFALGSKYIFYDILFLSFSSLSVSRFATLVVSFFALLFPTTLMGLSLPILSRAVVRGIENAARTIGQLYGVNTIGASLGAVIGGWFLVKYIGFESALYCGVAINLTASLLVYCLFGTVTAESPQNDQPVTMHGDGSGQVSTLSRITGHDLFWFAMVMLSGFMAISLQIVFFRLFETLFQGRAFAFAIVLANFLVFDAMGALIGTRLVRKIIDTQFSFFLLQGLIALAAVGCIWLFLLQGSWLHFFASSWIGSLLLLPAVIIGPAAFLIGLYFPIVQKAVQKNRQLVGMRTGLIDCGIVAGNTVGSMVTGLVLLDIFGTSGTLRILMFIGGAFLLCTMPMLHARTTNTQKLLAGALAGMVGLMLVFFPAQKKFWMTLNEKNQAEVINYYSNKFNIKITETAAFVSENKTGCALVQREKTEDGKFYSQLFYHGHIEGFIEPYVAIHVLLGSIGPLIHQAPKDILLVGLGSGGSAYASGINPKTEKIEVVEIATVLFDVLHKFLNQTQFVCLKEVLHSPRFSIIDNDARRFIMGVGKYYDIIESDPLMPETSGSNMLYSLEYFNLVKAKLKKNGLFVQWAPTARVENGVRRVFPHVLRIQVPPWQVLVASCEPLDIDLAALQKRYNSPEVKNYLELTGVTVHELQKILKTIEKAPPLDNAENKNVNTDLFPRDEYAQRLREVRM